MIRSLRRAITILLEGIAIGAANVIPGVSGGTMALIFGIYERLINILGTLFKAGLLLLKLDLPGALDLARGISWKFILLLFTGVLIAPVLGAEIIPSLMSEYPEASRSLFFGLILGTLPIPWLRIRRRGLKLLVYAALAAFVSFLLVGLPPTTIEDPGLLAVFLSAAVAICAMILPGISGAFLLLILGMYAPVLEAVEARDWTVITVFSAGAGIGLGSFALGLKVLLKKAHDETMAVLVGLMAGSLRSLWPWLSGDRSLQIPSETDPVSSVLIVGLAGLVLSVGVTIWEMRRRSDLPA